MSTCPTCGRDNQARQGSNGGDSLALDVPLAALPALEYALAIGRNTQMMCSGPEAKDMMEALRKKVDAAIPDCARIFRDRHWAALGARLAAGEWMTASVVKRGRSSWSSSWQISLHPVGAEPDTGYISEKSFETEEAAKKILAELPDAINRLTPMST